MHDCDAQPGDRFFGVLERNATGGMAVRRFEPALPAYQEFSAQAIL
jgi:hypothetical protein